MINRLRKVFIVNPFYWLAVLILLLIVIVTLIAPILPLDPYAVDVTAIMENPSSQHIFGTDHVGRDYFIRVLYGGRVSLLVGVTAMLVSVFIGTVVGLVSGYYGGFIDNLLMRIVDILQSIPFIILAIVLSVFLKPGLGTIIFIIGGFSWTNTARLVRAETLSLKNREYVQYAQFIHLSTPKIFTRHILPSLMPTIIVSATSSIAQAILTESTLSYLGVGIQQPIASWGNLLQDGQIYLQQAPHLALIPGFLIFLSVYAFNQLGNIVRDVVNMED